MATGESFDSLVSIVQTAGPSTILVTWLWFEIKERKRLQRLIEDTYLPLMGRHTKLLHSINRVMSGGREDGDSDDSDRI